MGDERDEHHKPTACVCDPIMIEPTSPIKHQQIVACAVPLSHAQPVQYRLTTGLTQEDPARLSAFPTTNQEGTVFRVEVTNVQIASF